LMNKATAEALAELEGFAMPPQRRAGVIAAAAAEDPDAAPVLPAAELARRLAAERARERVGRRRVAALVDRRERLRKEGKLDPPVATVLPDNEHELRSTERRPYELYLALNGVEHCKIKSACSRPTASSSASRAPCLPERCR
jgi:hypothetical protein